MDFVAFLHADIPSCMLIIFDEKIWDMCWRHTLHSFHREFFGIFSFFFSSLHSSPECLVWKLLEWINCLLGLHSCWVYIARISSTNILRIWEEIQTNWLNIDDFQLEEKQQTRKQKKIKKNRMENNKYACDHNSCAA